MRPTMGHLALGLIGMGFPLTQLAIRRFDKAGAVAAEAASAGMLARDLGLVVTGGTRRLRRAPAVLLWLETSAAAVASILGLPVIASAGARRQALDQRPHGSEIARRVALGTMFGMCAWRSWIELQKR